MKNKSEKLIRINYRIYFGSTYYNVQEWLYNYFNKVKKKKDKTDFQNLRMILMNVKGEPIDMTIK